ncbi:MAG: 16S rRNA (adenine(1518)-N(6)/adenine(1519)-N(6))-dimethyltransferase RsmA [Oscillospiraceae bacterium]
MKNLTSPSVIKEILAKHQTTFSKSLGQNFIINPGICPKIAEMGNAKEGFGILEIGTGIGVLTAELAKRAQKVVAIEIDSSLIPILNETLSEFDNIEIINEDFLKVDVKKLIEEKFKGLDVAVCANLPYYITSPIIMELLENKPGIKSITVMVQKEAAKRLCAPLKTKEAGAISIAVNYYSIPKILFNVSRGSFLPAPNVDSCVIRFDVREKPPIDVCDEKLFFKVSRAGFEQRRKTLLNALSSVLKIEKETIKNALVYCDLKQTARAEELTLKNFADLTEFLKDKI